MLAEHQVRYIAVDRDPRLVANARRGGKPVYFGDVRQLDFLRVCALDTAKAAIITIHTETEIDAIVQALRTSYPNLVIVSRAKDASHAQHLYEIGVNDAVPETIEASLQLSEAALVGLGVPTGLVIASMRSDPESATFTAVLVDLNAGTYAYILGPLMAVPPHTRFIELPQMDRIPDTVRVIGVSEEK